MRAHWLRPVRRGGRKGQPLEGSEALSTLREKDGRFVRLMQPNISICQAVFIPYALTPVSVSDITLTTLEVTSLIDSDVFL